MSDNCLVVGESIKPINPAGLVSNLMSRLYGLEVISWKELISYDDRNFLVSVHQEHKNPHLGDVDPDGYLLKIFNLRDSNNPQYIDATYALTDFIRKKGVPAPGRIPNLDGNLSSKQKIYTDLDDPSCTDFYEYIVLLQTFIPGSVVEKVPLTPQLIYRCGVFAGFIDKSLQDFYNPYYDNHQTIWSLKSVPKLVDFAFAIEDKKRRRIVDEVIDAYKREIIPLYPEFTKGQIHGDLNLLNILAREKLAPSDASDSSTTSTTGSSDTSSRDLSLAEEDEEHVLCGIIDFADSTRSFPVFDLSLVTTYLMIDCKLDEPLEVGGHALAGYLTEFNLKEVEKRSVPLLVCSRLVQSLVMGRYTYWKDPTNDYPLDTEKRGWPLLIRLWEHSMKEIYDYWEQIAKSQPSQERSSLPLQTTVFDGI